MYRGSLALSAVALVSIASGAFADDITVKMLAVRDDGVGRKIGTIRALDGTQGLVLTPRLSGLAPSAHGFHVHENPSCAARGADGRTGAGLAAGGHFDPDKTGKHEDLTRAGHKGDLPTLQVDEKGMAYAAVRAPRLKVADLRGRALNAHAGGDNHSDQPAPLGGGSARVACAAIAKAQAKNGGRKRP